MPAANSVGSPAGRRLAEVGPGERREPRRILARAVRGEPRPRRRRDRSRGPGSRQSDRGRFRAFRSAPPVARAFTTSRRPMNAASWSGVHPSRSASLHRRTSARAVRRRWPPTRRQRRRAAACRRVRCAPTGPRPCRPASRTARRGPSRRRLEQALRDAAWWPAPSRHARSAGRRPRAKPRQAASVSGVSPDLSFASTLAFRSSSRRATSALPGLPRDEQQRRAPVGVCGLCRGSGLQQPRGGAGRSAARRHRKRCLAFGRAGFQGGLAVDQD